MKRITVQRSGKRPLRFHGELVAEVGESMNNASPDYSGAPGRATNVFVYRTQQGKHVLAVHHRTCWQGEEDSYKGTTFDTAEDLVANLEQWSCAADEIADALGVFEDVE